MLIKQPITHSLWSGHTRHRAPADLQSSAKFRRPLAVPRFVNWSKSAIVTPLKEFGCSMNSEIWYFHLYSIDFWTSGQGRILRALEIVEISICSYTLRSPTQHVPFFVVSAIMDIQKIVHSRACLSCRREGVVNGRSIILILINFDNKHLIGNDSSRPKPMGPQTFSNP